MHRHKSSKDGTAAVDVACIGRNSVHRPMRQRRAAEENDEVEAKPLSATSATLALSHSLSRLHARLLAAALQGASTSRTCCWPTRNASMRRPCVKLSVSYPYLYVCVWCISACVICTVCTCYVKSTLNDPSMYVYPTAEYDDSASSATSGN